MTSKKNKEFNNTFEFETSYTPLQRPVINFFRSNNLSILTGDPGTGKSFSAIYYALMLLRDKHLKHIILSKPLVEVGQSIGYLPGGEAEKTAPYIESYSDVFMKIIGDASYRYLLNGKNILFQPINYIRGRTFENTLLIIDEAQNLTLHELITISTRIHESSKMIILGDESQSDIKKSGLSTFKSICEGVEGIGTLHLGDEYQMRHPMIVQLYKNYKKYLNDTEKKTNS